MVRMLMLGLALALAMTVTWCYADKPEKPLTPIEARKQVGKQIQVEMTVQAAKDRLEKRGEIYLDAQPDFKDEKNFAVVITREGAESLRKKGITDPAEHFRDKKIRASGKVKEVDGVPRIEIEEASQIKIVEEKGP
jgi:DNA/RNA endonuclease YhcR with UshA esterase domain